jgi:hypothetical protein
MEIKNNKNILLDEISIHELEPRLELVAAASKKTVTASYTPPNDGMIHLDSPNVELSF